MANGGLYVPVNAPWWPEFRRELLSFPAGKHDDQVDALGLAGQLLDKMMEGNAPALEGLQRRKRYQGKSTGGASYMSA